SEFYPDPPLSSFVECVWTLTSSTPSTEPQVERILPDGCVELILNFGSRFTQHTESHHQLQPRNFVVGQMTGPVLISPAEAVDLLGIRFHPGGAYPFLRVPMNAITDQLIELGSLSKALESRLLTACEYVSTPLERVVSITAALVKKLPLTVDTNLMALTESIVNSVGVVSVDRLANDAGISSRQLERRFLSGVGLGPKVLSRILRFQQVFRAVERGDNSWAEVALDCGYYDQAHL